MTQDRDDLLPWFLVVLLSTVPHSDRFRWYCIRGIDMTAPNGFSIPGWAWWRGPLGDFHFKMPVGV